MTPTRPSVTAVVLAFGAEPLLVQCVEALVTQDGVSCSVLVVDNGVTSDAVSHVATMRGVTILSPGQNLGFAAGANLGASAATSDYLAFVNSDVIAYSTAMLALVDALRAPGVGLATASVRLRQSPDRMNSSGNPVHFLGLSWAGGLGDPAALHSARRDVAAVSGAAFACSKDTWNLLGGFFEPLFLYHEDTELSLRCWKSGLRVVYEPKAIVEHEYDFSRNPDKLKLLERNRLVLMLTLWGPRTSAATLPALLALEVAMLGVAMAQGWGLSKLKGYAWLMRNAALIRDRRRSLASMDHVPDSQVLALLTARFDPGRDTGMTVPPWIQAVSVLYWRGVCRLLAVPAVEPAHPDQRGSGL